MYDDLKKDDVPDGTDDAAGAREEIARREAAGSSPAQDDLKTLNQVTDVLLSLLRDGEAQDLSLKNVSETLERNVIIKALLTFNGHQAKTASFLGLLPTTLSAKMKKYKIAIEYKTASVQEDSPGDDAVPGSGQDPAKPCGEDLDPTS